MNFSRLLFAFDFCGGVEALAGLLGFLGDDGLIFFDVFVMMYDSKYDNKFFRFKIYEKMINTYFPQMLFVFSNVYACGVNLVLSKLFPLKFTRFTSELSISFTVTMASI